MPDTNLILHVKGTERETTSLPKQAVRAAIVQGQITHSQLIWSTSENTWKQVREMPHLLPSQKMAPVPMPRTPTGNLPPISVAAVQTGLVPRIARVATDASGTPVAGQAGVPKARTAVSGQPSTAERSLVVKEKEDGIDPMKWLCLILGVLIIGLLGVNYLWVQQPLEWRLSQTPYGKVTVYAHLGAFLQPNVVIIHIPASTSLTNDNLADFLVALAGSTPNAPGSGNTFERVALTSGWMGRYNFSGYAWKQLGGMGHEEPAQRKEFLLDQMADAGGQPVVTANSTLSDTALQAERDRVWSAFASQFVRP